MTRVALELSNFDYDVVDRFLEMVLNEHRTGNLALSEARDAISEAFSMAAFDNRGVTRYMQVLIEVRGKWESPLLAGNGQDQVATVMRSAQVQKCDRVGKATGPEVGKRTNGDPYSKHKHEPGQPASCLPESRQ